MASRDRSAWLMMAVASGACAAFNGVFAKLTTTELTSTWAHAVSGAFNLRPDNKFVEILIRAIFFVLNLIFNAIMWALFTRALTLASSTVRVSVINTSANFMITAVLGALIFSEVLPGLWWLGAAMLVAGSVIIGRRDEGKELGSAGTAGEEPAVGAGTLGRTGEREREGEREEEGAPLVDRFTDEPADADGGRESVELQAAEEGQGVK